MLITTPPVTGLMHIASKITLIVGTLMLVGSIIGVIAGVGGATSSGYQSESYLEQSNSGTFTVEENESWEISIYVVHPVDCETLELSIVDSNGDNVVYPNWCELEDNSDEYYTDGQEEYYGSVLHEVGGAQYTLESNVKVNVRGDYCDSDCEKALGGAFVSGGLGVLGVCCAIPMLVIGVILAFVLDDPKQGVVMPMGQMQTGQAVYQAPVPTQMSAGQNLQQGYGQPMQQMGAQQAQIMPPLTQQPQQSQPAQITPPLTQPSAESPWDNL
jgi:hypothetical protein